MTERALSPDFGVKCLEAPEWPPVPQALRRELDGRSVYTAPGTERYATHGQLSMEEALCQRAQRHGAPCLEREALAARLGTDADVLDAGACLPQVAQCETRFAVTTTTAMRSSYNVIRAYGADRVGRRSRRPHPDPFDSLSRRHRYRPRLDR